MDEIHDVLINEGLSRWDWYFYLTILRRTPPRPFKGPDVPRNLSMAIMFQVRDRDDTEGKTNPQTANASTF